MLSPVGHGGKNPAPSIWSYDSGYGSGNAPDEERPANGAFYLQSSTSNNSLEGRLGDVAGLGLACFSDFHIDDQALPRVDEPAIDPIDTKLSVFTIKKLPDFRPGLTDDETCLRCELWNITNPGENVRCEDCRMPEVVEPSELLIDGSVRNEQVEPTLGALTPSKVRLHQLSTRTRCSACELSALVDPSASIRCASCIPSSPDIQSPLSPSATDYKVKRSRAGRQSKLPLSALNRLQAWLDAHTDNPYPSSEEKRQLAVECVITEKQVGTWFTNARARQLSPLDTWLSSGSEDDGAAESDIERAAGSGGFTYLSESMQRGPGYRRAGSVSGSSAFSTGQSRPQPSRRGKKKNYRRNNNNANLPPLITEWTQDSTTGNDQEMWQCTFCRKVLVPKSWRRHEETQHRPRAQWTCMLFGPRLSVNATPRTSSGLLSRSSSNVSTSYCAFCMHPDPPEDHFLAHHRISECAKRPTKDRTFFRPDHLRQHVKNFHGATLFDIAQTRWKQGPAESNSEEGWVCGFCGDGLETWDKRQTHIANHFKEGLTMDHWREDLQKCSKKVLKKQGKEKKDEKERDHPHGLARLGRTLTRRSTRSSTRNSALQPLANAGFSNAFESLPMPLDHQAFSPPPVLPNINMDPLMDNFSNFVDWNQVPQDVLQVSGSQYADNLVFDPALQTDFDAALENVLSYGNPVDYHEPWNHQPQQH